MANKKGVFVFGLFASLMAVSSIHAADGAEGTWQSAVVPFDELKNPTLKDLQAAAEDMKERLKQHFALRVNKCGLFSFAEKPFVCDLNEKKCTFTFQSKYCQMVLQPKQRKVGDSICGDRQGAYLEKQWDDKTDYILCIPPHESPAGKSPKKEAK